MQRYPVTIAVPSRRRLRPCAIAVAGLLAAGCTHTVVAPDEPARPVSAFLLDHGRHASLVVPAEQGLTRYAYGDWSYYARNRTGPLRASGTLLGSNRAGLGRRRVPGDAALDAVRRRVRVPVEAAWRIEVAGARATALARRLDRIFRQQARSRIDNPRYDLEFVHHPAPYNVGHNSNHVTGEWLRALGCRVRMRGPFSAWRVRGASAVEARRSPATAPGPSR